MNRYQQIPKEKVRGNLVYRTSRYPEIPLSENDIYVFTTQGDRFDILALQYYKDSSLWWVIAVANTEVFDQNSLIIPEGIQIRIPSNPSFVVREFNVINT